MKKLICCMLALLLCLSGIALAEEEKNDLAAEYPEIGFNLRLPPDVAQMKGSIMTLISMKLDTEPAVCLYSAVYLAMTDEDYYAYALDPETEDRVIKALMPFLDVIGAAEDTSLEELGKVLGIPLSADEVKLITTVDGYAFYRYQDTAQTEVPEGFAEEYADLMGKADAILEGCDFYAPVDPYAQQAGKKLSFETVDLDGNPVSSEELFSRHEYTLLNIWASWCGPCARELGELDALNNRLADADCGVVGLLEDSAEEGTVQTAKDLMAEKGAHYLCIQAPEGLDGMLVYKPYPTTYIVDRSGAIVGTPIVGAYVDAYEEAVMNLLNANGAEAEEAPKEGQAAYTVIVTDQNGEPVPGAAVGFCLETGCIPVETDENGAAVYSGAPARYHIQVVDAPDGYDYPDDTDLYIGPESGQETLVITKE